MNDWLSLNAEGSVQSNKNDSTYESFLVVISQYDYLCEVENFTDSELMFFIQI